MNESHWEGIGPEYSSARIARYNYIASIFVQVRTRDSEWLWLAASNPISLHTHAFHNMIFIVYVICIARPRLAKKRSGKKNKFYSQRLNKSSFLRSCCCYFITIFLGSRRIQRRLRRTDFPFSVDSVRAALLAYLPMNSGEGDGGVGEEVYVDDGTLELQLGTDIWGSHLRNSLWPCILCGLRSALFEFRKEKCSNLHLRRNVD